jgi:uncharacterized protein (DUF305 family)
MVPASTSDVLREARLRPSLNVVELHISALHGRLDDGVDDPHRIPLMSGMYKDKTLNAVILGAGILALAGSFLMIRQQTAVGDRQFLRSMIPHHAGAVLMCEEASLQDAEILKLCGEIVANQREEIAIMKRKLRALAE